VYCSHVIAAQVNALQPGLPLWVFKVPTTDVHASSGPPFSQANPSGCGYGGALMWQLEQEAVLTMRGMPGSLKADFSSSNVSNPSAPPPALV
jgi:hypothetical protein